MKTEWKNRQKRAGFTLIEIMLVVVIIGMLATVAVVNVPKYLKKSQVTTARTQISGLGGSLDMYLMEEGKYPSSLSALASGSEPIIPSVPKDPWKQPYTYNYPGSHKPYPYDLQTTAPDGTIIANWNANDE